MGGENYSDPKVAAAADRAAAERHREAAKLAETIAEREAGVSVHVKQDSGPRSGQQGRIPDELFVRDPWPWPEVAR